MLIAYDCRLKRPGCVLVAAGIGADPEVSKRFPSETWLLAPTDDMRVYEATDAQIDLLVRMAAASTEEGRHDG